MRWLLGTSMAAGVGWALVVVFSLAPRGSLSSLIYCGHVLEALHVRRAATVSSAPLHDAADDDRIGAGDEIERAEQRVLLDGLMRVLGPAERVVVRLRVVDGMTGAQIAAAVGLTEIQVSRVVRRALARMHDAATAQEIVHA